MSWFFLSGSPTKYLVDISHLAHVCYMKAHVLDFNFIALTIFDEKQK
jgi:hypothetical protein